MDGDPFKKARKAFFFEKRSKKLLLLYALRSGVRDSEQKFFASFFKKEGLSYLPCSQLRTRRVLRARNADKVVQELAGIRLIEPV